METETVTFSFGRELLATITSLRTFGLEGVETVAGAPGATEAFSSALADATAQHGLEGPIEETATEPQSDEEREGGTEALGLESPVVDLAKVVVNIAIAGGIDSKEGAASAPLADAPVSPVATTTDEPSPPASAQPQASLSVQPQENLKTPASRQLASDPPQRVMVDADPSQSMSQLVCDAPGQEPPDEFDSQLWVQDRGIERGAEAKDGSLPIRVTMLETHLPPAVAREIAHMSASSEDNAVTAPLETGAAPPKPSSLAPVKILRFELEPASLGPVFVKMRMMQASVEIEIEARSQGALSYLQDAREQIAAAVSATGCTIEALDVRIVHSASSDTGRQHDHGDTAFSPRDFQSQRQGHSDDEAPQERSRPHRSAPAHAASDGRAHSDNRGGGVYL